MKAIITLLIGCMFFNAVAQKIPMFIGTYTNKGSQGIYFYQFDLSNGEATMYSNTTSEDPSFLARSADGKSLYAVNEKGDSTATLSSFAFDDDALSFVNAIPTGGTYPCHVAVSKRYPIAIVSNYGGGSLALFSIEENGALGDRVQLIEQVGSGPNKDRQESSHVHSAFFSPDEKFVYVQNLGTDKVTVYRVEKKGTSFSLVEDSVIDTPAAGGPRHIALDSKAKNLYVLLEMSGMIAHYQREKKEWIRVDTISINKDDFTGKNGAAEIKLSSDGEYVYASNRGQANSIAQFAVEKDGKLTKLNVYSTGGEGPRNFNITPDGHYLLVANQNSDNIVVFQRDIETGVLKNLEKDIQIATPVCIVF